jgi:hypothetical protein
MLNNAWGFVMKINGMNELVMLALVLVSLGLNLAPGASQTIADRTHNLTSERGILIWSSLGHGFLLSAKDRQTEECQLERRCKPDTAQRLDPVNHV